MALLWATGFESPCRSVKNLRFNRPQKGQYSCVRISNACATVGVDQVRARHTTIAGKTRT